MKKIHDWVHALDLSAVFTIIGVLVLFSISALVVLVAPTFVDSTWTMPTSSYQVQMYEVADPHFYISSAGTGGQQLQFVYHLKQEGIAVAFQEDDLIKIDAPPELEKYVTRAGDKVLKLTHKVLLLRPKENGYELFIPETQDAFAVSSSDGILQDWIDRDYKLLDGVEEKEGIIYIKNPHEFKVSHYEESGLPRWRYDSEGDAVASLADLIRPPLSFRSRKELIGYGENIYAVEGCWYCHTDQTRTLIQDLVLNGSESFPAPPSTPNEYIYQQITFPGTKRNGPDISRVGVKKQSRDWHKAHFWSPKTASAGSIMPSFRHFFDFDPRGTSPLRPGVPNEKFEAVFQYLMTKGTRITPPNEAWWLGKDPIQTKEIIEGRKRLP